MPQEPTSEKTSGKLVGVLRTRLLTGLVVTAPIALTVWLVWSLVSWIDARFKPLIPQQWNPETYIPFALPGLGVLVLVLCLILIGSIAPNLIGKSILNLGEKILGRVPLVRNVYQALKQIAQTLTRNQSGAFQDVVLIGFPRKGVWAIGFVITEIGGEIGNHLNEHVSVLVPTAPNPTSGFIVFAQRSDLIPLSMNVEDAAKAIMSGGLILPKIEQDNDNPAPTNT